MMQNSRQRLILLTSALLFLGGFSLPAQDNADMLSRQQALLYQKWYDSQKNQSGIYNGREYLDYTRLLKEGHAFFDTTVALTGSVRYNQVTYENIQLMLDLITDELIVRHFNNIFLIQLVKDKVDWFNIKGHHFEHLGRDMGLSPGFYDRVYDGNNIKMYVRRRKMIQEVIQHMTIEKIVHPEDRYYIVKDGQFHTVRSKSSVIKLLGNKRQLNQSLRQNNIRFKANRELAIKTMVEASDTF